MSPRKVRGSEEGRAGRKKDARTGRGSAWRTNRSSQRRGANPINTGMIAQYSETFPNDIRLSPARVSKLPELVPGRASPCPATPARLEKAPARRAQIFASGRSSVARLESAAQESGFTLSLTRANSSNRGQPLAVVIRLKLQDIQCATRALKSRNCGNHFRLPSVELPTQPRRHPVSEARRRGGGSATIPGKSGHTSGGEPSSVSCVVWQVRRGCTGESWAAGAAVQRCAPHLPPAKSPASSWALWHWRKRWPTAP
jgi:hypothetical protein